MRAFASTSSKLRQVLDMVDPSVADVIRDVVLTRQSSKTSIAKLAITLATLMQRDPENQPSSVELGRIADWAAAIGNDWRKHASDLDSLKAASDDWHSQLAANADESAEYVVEDQTVLEFPDGWRIVRIDPENASVEGTIMGHCIGTYADKMRNDWYWAYSLRDPRNRPHVTFGFNMKNGSDETNLHTLDQVQGKSDQPPIDKYRPYLRRFFSNRPDWEPWLSVFDREGDWKEGASLDDNDTTLLRLLPVSKVMTLVPDDHKVLEDVAATDVRPYLQKIMGEKRNPTSTTQNAIIGKLSQMIMQGLATPEEEEYFRQQLADPRLANHLVRYLYWDESTDDGTIRLEDKVPEVNDAVLRLVQWVEEDETLSKPATPYSSQSEDWKRWMMRDKVKKILHSVPKRLMQKGQTREILLDKARNGGDVEDLMFDKWGLQLEPWADLERDLFGPDFRPVSPERLAGILKYMHMRDKDRVERILSNMDVSLLREIAPHLRIDGHHYLPSGTKPMFTYTDAPTSHKEVQRRRETEQAGISRLVSDRFKDPNEGQTPFPEMVTASRVLHLAAMAEEFDLPELSDRLEGLL